MVGCVVLIWWTTAKIWRLWNDWDWIKSACQLRGLDCSGLGVLIITMCWM